MYSTTDDQMLFNIFQIKKTLTIVLLKTEVIPRWLAG